MNLATYVFPDRESAESARGTIVNELGTAAAWCSGNEVHITSDCRDVQLASKICKSCGGRAK